MQTSFDRRQWQDNDLIEQAVSAVCPTTPPSELRRLFPYAGVAIRDLPFYHIKKGTMFPYLRLRESLQQYPIQGIIGVQGAEGVGQDSKPHQLFLSSNEVQVYKLS